MRVTLAYRLSIFLTVLFYIIYSLLPTIFSISSIYFDEGVYFFPSLVNEDILKIASVQVLGFIVLIYSLPSYSLKVNPGFVIINVNKNIVNFFAFVLMLYTIPALVQMYFESSSVFGRVDLFGLFSDISSVYKLNYIFLLLSALTIYLIFISNNYYALIYLLPLVLMEILAMGRVWPYSYFILFLFAFINKFNKLLSAKQIIVICIAFLSYSLIRIEVATDSFDLVGILIFMFGEAYNTQQTIDIVLSTATRSSALLTATNLISDFIPFGLKYFIQDTNNTVVNLIDMSKNELYGSTNSMGYGSSWLAQFIIYFGLSWSACFYPFLLSLSIRLFLKIVNYSELFGVIYLYFYISGLFLFFRYGFSLALSYPLTNLLNVITLLFFISTFGVIKKTSSLS